MLFADPELASWLAALLAVGRPDRGVDGTALLDAIDWAMKSGSPDSNHKKM
jgi:hypothetical protein